MKSDEKKKSWLWELCREWVADVISAIQSIRKIYFRKEI